MKPTITTIKVTTTTVAKLKKVKIYKHESYDEIINRLLIKNGGN